MKYWYENTGLLQGEMDGFNLFAQDYKGLHWIEPGYDEDKHFIAVAELEIEVTKEAMLAQALTLPDHIREHALERIKALSVQPKRVFQFHIQYEHDFPGRGSKGTFGGAIKAFPMDELKPGLSHMLFDKTVGQYYICQAESLDSSEVNSNAMMWRIVGFLPNYIFWEKTGFDLDILGDGAWRK